MINCKSVAKTPTKFIIWVKVLSEIIHEFETQEEQESELRNNTLWTFPNFLKSLF